MPVVNESRPEPAGRPRGRLPRVATLLAHRTRIDAFISDHRVAAVAVFAALYAAAALLVLPTGFLLAVLAGFLFGAAAGGFAALVGSVAGATVMFLVARSAFGEHLLRAAGPRAERFAAR